jgi:hypothetical protein
MKHLIFTFLAIGTTMIFFGCSKDNPLAPELNQNDPAATSLAKRMVTPFSGVEKFVALLEQGTMTLLPNGRVLARGHAVEYYDEASDPRVTGKSEFTASGIFDDTFSGPAWGTGVLIPDIGGRWDIKFVAKISSTEGNIVEAFGHGKGAMKGLVAHWTYKSKPGETDYTIEGFIVEHYK